MWQPSRLKHVLCAICYGWVCASPRREVREGRLCFPKTKQSGDEGGDGISDLNWAGTVYAVWGRDASDLFVSTFRISMLL
ncbi:uncharacterized protein BDV14DRAFT_178989, partial [Aspergillus stella-maris]|uniref:uncharacterized protein n=1 Tax=Aspergillus stella-maris TaxID=1810926 RepID=UPI003CCDD945